MNLLALSHLTADSAMTQKIERTLASAASRMTHASRAAPMMLAALSTYHRGMPQVVLVGDPAASESQALVRAAYASYLPSALIVRVFPAHQQRLASLLPWIGSLPDPNGRPAAYVCRDFACQLPAMTAGELALQLKAL